MAAQSCTGWGTAARGEGEGGAVCQGGHRDDEGGRHHFKGKSFITATTTTTTVQWAAVRLTHTDTHTYIHTHIHTHTVSDGLRPLSNRSVQCSPVETVNFKKTKH